MIIIIIKISAPTSFDLRNLEKGMLICIGFVQA